MSVPYDSVQERACLVFFGWVYINRISALGYVHSNHMVNTNVHFINSCNCVCMHACATSCCALLFWKSFLIVQMVAPPVRARYNACGTTLE